MKAYGVQAATRGDEYGEIVFAATPGKAKQAACSELDCEWLDIISCRRTPEYDHLFPGPVPRKTLLEDGWTFECGACYRRVWDSPEVVWVGQEPCCDDKCAKRCKQMIENAALDAAEGKGR